MSNTVDVTGGKPIAVWSQSISGTKATYLSFSRFFSRHSLIINTKLPLVILHFWYIFCKFIRSHQRVILYEIVKFLHLIFNPNYLDINHWFDWQYLIANDNLSCFYSLCIKSREQTVDVHKLCSYCTEIKPRLSAYYFFFKYRPSNSKNLQITSEPHRFRTRAILILVLKWHKKRPNWASEQFPFFELSVIIICVPRIPGKEQKNSTSLFFLWMSYKVTTRLIALTPKIHCN
jgi:hypothetical protein